MKKLYRYPKIQNTPKIYKEKIDEFIEQSRYNPVFELSFHENSNYAKTLKAIMPKIKKILFATSAKYDNNSYEINLSLIDMTKFMILDRIRSIYNFNSKILQLIAMSLTYNEYILLEPKTTDKDIISYYKYRELFLLIHKKLTPLQLSEKISLIEESVKREGIKIVHDFHLKDHLEKAIYYILNYKKGLSIFISFDKGLKEVNNIDYKNIFDIGLDMPFEGIVTDLHMLLGAIEIERKNYKMRENNWQSLDQIEKNIDVVMNKKSDYILQLMDNRMKIAEDDIDSYNTISEEIDRCSIEFDLGINGNEPSLISKKGEGVTQLFNDLLEVIHQGTSTKIKIELRSGEPVFMDFSIRDQDLKKYEEIKNYKRGHSGVTRSTAIEEHGTKKSAVISKGKIKYKK